jgi:hypothetical protein
VLTWWDSLSYDQKTLCFGIASTLLYLFWARFQLGTKEPHQAGALVLYAGANVFLLWPVIRRVCGF